MSQTHDLRACERRQLAKSSKVKPTQVKSLHCFPPAPLQPPTSTACAQGSSVKFYIYILPFTFYVNLL